MCFIAALLITLAVAAATFGVTFVVLTRHKRQ